jgi:hypothetical protein
MKRPNDARSRIQIGIAFALLFSWSKIANVPIAARKPIAHLDEPSSKVARFTNCLPSAVQVRRKNCIPQRNSHFRKPKLAHAYATFLQLVL